MIKTAVKLVFLGLLLHWMWGRQSFFKFGHYYHTAWPGECRAVAGISKGAEDAELVTANTALITSGLCLSKTCTRGRGNMFMFDFSKPDTGATPVSIVWTSDQKEKQEMFGPHGMTVWHGTGDPIVMVVNHELEMTEKVEIFTYSEKTNTLHHLETIHVPEFTSLNDLKATGPRSFYFTNFAYTKIPTAAIEMALGICLGSVGHFDGGTNSAQIVTSGLCIANGVQMSHDGHYVYVAEFEGSAVSTFKRHNNNSLSLVKRLLIHSAPDNLALEASNSDLWVGGLSVPGENFMGKRETSQVLRLPLQGGVPTGEIRQVYAGNHELIAGSSIGLPHRNHLFIGTVQEKAAICDMNYRG